MTTVLAPNPRPTAPRTAAPEARRRSAPVRPVSPQAGMSLLAALPLGSVVEVSGGALISARVREVRHEPSGSAVTLVGRCPERLGAASGSVLATRSCPGPLQEMTLRWGVDGSTTQTRLPVEVAPGDVVVVFSPRFQGRSGWYRALADRARV